MHRKLVRTGLMTFGMVLILATGSHGQTGALSELDDGGVELAGANQVVLSPDGKNAYATGNVVAILERDQTAGTLTQVSGTDGCISEDGSGGLCTVGRGVSVPGGIAVSHDGKHVYVAAFLGGVATFSRDKATGRLTQLPGVDGCITPSGSGGLCASGRALDGANGVAVTRDGKHVYVAAINGGLAIFARNSKTGALTQLPGANGCIMAGGDGMTCAAGRGLSLATTVAVAPNSKSVYVVSQSDNVAIFARDRKTGVLDQLAGAEGCVGAGSDATCALGRGLDDATAIAISKSGANAYVASSASDAVAVFRRDAKTGGLEQLTGTDGCVSASGSGGACATGRALDGAIAVAITSDGHNVYAAAALSNAVAIFARNSKTGALSQLPGSAGCASEDPQCTTVSGLFDARGLALPSNGKHVYVAASTSGAVSALLRATR